MADHDDTLREAWAANADAWAVWARTPDHDHFFWRYNLPRFLEIVPDAGVLTLDLGCGEGRLGRVLMERGHNVIGLDSSPTLARLAATHAEPMRSVVGDAATLPFPGEVADLAIAFMSFQDVDDLAASGEAGRVLRPGGRFCLAILHPLVTAGNFVDDTIDSEFTLERSYSDPERFVETMERNGLTMEFHSVHRPLSLYADALHDGGFMIETVAEPLPTDDHVRDFPSMARQRRVPWWLHLRAVRI